MAQRPVRHRPARPRRKPASSGNPVKAVAVAVGAVGLVALAVAILGPKRLQKEVLVPLQKAVGPQAEKIWDQTRPIRSQLASVLHRAGGERERLARDLQSWIGHFRAS
jgi:hypothetical protein